MLTCEDKELLKQKGITEEQIAEQLACFEKGFPFLQLAGAASVDNNGIDWSRILRLRRNIWKHGMLTCRALQKL